MPTPELDRPTISTGEVLYCEDCRPAESRKLDDFRYIPCPCGATHSDGMRKGARYIAR